MHFAATGHAHWVFHPRRSDERARSLAAALDAPLPVAHALVNRGLDTEEKARRFLDPALENLHDPRHMLGLEEGAARILAAVEKRERIFIQGDYDVDGITSTFLLYSVLKELGAKVEYRIPDRTRDGYGLDEKAMREAKHRDCTLVLTVDCGITAVEAVALGNTLGIDTVITDHHEPASALPDAVAVINPLRPGCPYPFKSLAGVGVVFKLVERLLQGNGGLDRARQYLDVVALGTIADVVPLVGENRILAREGLDLLNRRERPGLRALMNVASLDQKRITSGHVAFVLAPRINASGRVGSAEQGIRLLLATQEDEANACAQSLEEDNKKRRGLDSRALEEACAKFETELKPGCCSIVLWSEAWHAGVIGIVASRLVERYRLPALLVSVDGDRGRGSGRSLPGLDLTRLLDGCTDLLLTHGGHAFAAGLSIERDQLPALRERFERLVREQYDPEKFAARHDVDDELQVADCTTDLVDWIERMAPHGLDNSEPQFQLLGARVDRVTRVGKGRHVRLRVRGEEGDLDAIGFGMGDLAPSLERSGRADLLFVPTRNEWNHDVRVQLKLKAVRVA